jgi:hypothetical protein
MLSALASRIALCALRSDLAAMSAVTARSGRRMTRADARLALGLGPVVFEVGSVDGHWLFGRPVAVVLTGRGRMWRNNIISIPIIINRGPYVLPAHNSDERFAHISDERLAHI